jgi:hypothetical protein
VPRKHAHGTLTFHIFIKIILETYTILAQCTCYRMNCWHPLSRLKFHSMTIVSLSNRVESWFIWRRVFTFASFYSITYQFYVRHGPLFGAYVEIMLVCPPVPSINAVQEFCTKTLSGRHEFGVNQSIILTSECKLFLTVRLTFLDRFRWNVV